MGNNNSATLVAALLHCYVWWSPKDLNLTPNQLHFFFRGAGFTDQCGEREPIFFNWLERQDSNLQCANARRVQSPVGLPIFLHSNYLVSRAGFEPAILSSANTLVKRYLPNEMRYQTPPARE